MIFSAKICYTIDKNHPDIEYITDWEKGKIFTYDDTYVFTNEHWTKSEAIEYIKRDLKLIAGGGCNSDHIHDVKFHILKKQNNKIAISEGNYENYYGQNRG